MDFLKTKLGDRVLIGKELARQAGVNADSASSLESREIVYKMLKEKM